MAETVKLKSLLSMIGGPIFQLGYPSRRVIEPKRFRIPSWLANYRLDCVFRPYLPHYQPKVDS